jgi:hypothetical protein
MGKSLNHLNMKYYLLAIVAIAILVGCFWLFNHVNAWIGIIAFLLSAGGIVQFIINEVKKTNNKMKKVTYILFGAVMLLTLASCERVAPNYYGVLMENYGKSGKGDYSKQQGRVNIMAPGTELFQVPAFEQRAEFTNEDGTKRVLQLKAADNTAFTANPLYSYKAQEGKVVDLVFQNARLGSGDDFMRNLENNILEPHIYDLIKEESRKYTTDTLMASGGSLKFEERVQELVKKSFDEKGLDLITFSANLDFSDKVKAKIDSRNEVNTNISVLDQQIAEQKKRNELAELKAQENLILSKGITQQLLQQQFIEKWNGATPLYGNMPVTLMKKE